MITISSILVFVLCSLHFLNGELIELRDIIFNQTISKVDTCLVVFYAPWCAQCKNLIQNLEKGSRELSSHDPAIKIFKVDCEHGGRQTCEDFNIGSYPMLKSFKNGQIYGRYDGKHDVPSIIEFMLEEAAPVSQEFLSEDDLEEWIEKHDKPTLAVALEDAETFKKIYLNLATRWRRKIKFAHFVLKLPSETRTARRWIKLFRTPALRNKFENDAIDYNGPRQAADIETFMKKHYHGLVGYRKPTNKNEFGHPLVVAYYDVDYVKNAKFTNYWRNRILKVALKYRGKFSFAISSRADFKEELEEFQPLPSNQLTPIVCVFGKDNDRYMMEEEFSIVAVETFLNDIAEGKASPHLKSQPLPIGQEGDVIVAVGANFYETVMYNNKDVLLKLYAPWCTYCVKLEPTFDELATMLKYDLVDIVKLDATKNEVPSTYAPQGYPTIWWAGRDSKYNPILYEVEGRTIDDFIKFIAKHSTHQLINYDRNGNYKILPKHHEL